MKIAISGAGIAGPTLAHWLLRYGHEPTLIEKAPAFRSGGYVIDFWGIGYTIAEKMGVLADVLTAGYLFKDLRLVDSDGCSVGGFPTDAFHRLANGRFTSLPRGDLAEIIYRTVEGQVETIFDNAISAIEESAGGVLAGFEHGPPRDFDLLVGADGLHSRVRKLAFGPEDEFEKQLGFRVATFEVQGYRPRDELTFVARATPGRQLARISLRDDRTMFLFVFRAELMSREDPVDIAGIRAVLNQVFRDAGWEAPQILKAMETAGEIYFDQVDQIRMPTWSKGRVVLIGDAACAVSLLAGEGTGLAMTQAYVLAGELKRAGLDYGTAFSRYESQLRAFIEGKQKSAGKFASSFVPKSAFGTWFRNQVTRMMRLPLLADFVIARSVNMKDDFDLPDYDK